MIAGAVATPATPVENETPFKRLKRGLLSSVPSTQEFKEAGSFDVNKDESTVTITVVGASGDLAKKKIFPALFALYYEGCLPKVQI
jgi:glucose-6-phosphate 1-dehydrogenase